MKQDAVPGREIGSGSRRPSPAGTSGPCAELCGLRHSGMRGWIYVHTPDEYGSGRRRI